MKKNYRKGAIGALLDEYERALEELKTVLNSMSQEEYVAIKDTGTSDPDCKSVQTIMNHVVRAGYGYCNYIRKQFGDPFIERKEFYDVETPQAACKHLDEVLVYTEETLQNKYDLTFDEVMKNVIKTNWGQQYDFDQLMEHAIVYILRHRRQIEKFMDSGS